MTTSFTNRNEGDGYYIYRRYITVNGRRIYPRRARAFRIWIKLE